MFQFLNWQSFYKLKKIKLNIKYSKEQEKNVSFYSSIQKIFSSHFLVQTFEIYFLVWIQLEPERHTRCLQSQPKFHLSY